MPERDYYLPGRNLVSNKDSEIIEQAQVPRSRFTGAWTRKTTFDAGYLVPFLVEEILPGDNMKYKVTAYVRMATPLFPIFDNQKIDTFFFFVPNRLVWTNWVRLMGEQPTGPADSIAFTVPQRMNAAPGYNIGTLGDYMGLPTNPMLVGGVAHNVLPFRAYGLIWNQWFRDQNLQNAVVVSVADGPDVTTSVALMQRAKMHDYFTSALPWPQKFTPPGIPISGFAPVTGIGTLTGVGVAGPVGVRETNDPAAIYPFWQGTDVAGQFAIRMDDDVGVDNDPLIFADLTAAGVAIDVNAFRLAYMVQSLLERDARGGTRYTEMIRAHFGVTNPDFRLQRPEYIGGGSTPLQITPIAQTAPTAGAPLGVLGGTGTSAGQHTASYAATEHGFIIGLINVRSELSYQQGQHKMWNRLTRLEYYFPATAALGEQAILVPEIFENGTGNTTVFGYQERWHEYRTRYSEVTGVFRSTAAINIDEWHLAQLFGGAPVLNNAFIVDDPPMARVLAAGALAVNQEYIADILIERQAVRPLPMYGTPQLLGRF